MRDPRERRGLCRHGGADARAVVHAVDHAGAVAGGEAQALVAPRGLPGVHEVVHVRVEEAVFTVEQLHTHLPHLRMRISEE